MADQTFAVHCGFFDAISSDRTYSADEMNRPYKRVISNGVFATPSGTPSTDLQVVASSGMGIICKKGEGLFGDKWFENPSGIAITVPSNTGTVPRIDSVIVQVDTRTSGRVGNIVHRTGTPASSPVPPAINQVEGVIEYRLANIRVNAGVSAITGSMITDRRGSSDCPWVTSLIYQVDTSTLYDQWAAAYAEYFEQEKAIWDAWYAQLTEDLDVSMTLDRRTNTVTTTERTFDVSIGLDYNHNTDILEVYINGLRVVEGTQYNVNDDTSISLINPVSSGQSITFVVLKSVISGSATTIMTILQTLEEKIAGIAGGTPTVVDSVSDMTDTEKIYILSTDGKWYYYSATQEDWVIGGTYGGVPTDPTLTQEGMAADAKAVGDALDNVTIEVDATLTQAGKAADAKAVGDALALKANTADIDALENDVTSIEEALFATIDHNKSVSVPVAVGDFKNSTIILEDTIPAGQTFTIRLNTAATHGNISVYADYSDSTYTALTYNAALNTDLTYTKDKEIALFKVQVAGGFTSAGTLSFSASYTTQTENSVEEQLENLTTNMSTVQDDFDIIYHDYLVETGYDLISEWVSGDIDSNGDEISSGSYYRTNKVDVDESKTYYLAQVAPDSEGTTKVTAWGNNSYGIIHCYSDSDYIGVAPVGTGNTSGIFTPLTGTTKVCISHVYQNSTTIHMYELNGTSGDDRQDIIPTDHDDVYEKSFDSATMTKTKISGEQLDFMANDGTTLVTKDTASPWFIFSNYIISEYIPFNAGSYYIQCVMSGMTGMYIRCYDADKTRVGVVSLGNYQTATRFTVPDSTRYIRVIAGKSSPKLSDLTSMNIYTFTSRSLGYTPMHDVIDVNMLPMLPPTATTGRNGGGIICIGHGGLSSIYAEDSIESFYGLAHNGFDGSEVDIQFTKDHVPVCWHDGSLGSLEGGTSNDHIWDYTLAELDANFDFRTWWDKRDCFRSTVARFEEVCILARAYGWYIMPDKCLGAEADRATNMQVLIDMINKYDIKDKFIVQNSFSELRAAFPNNMFNLTAMQTAVDETWINGLLNNVIPDLCHQDGQGNMIVNDGVEVTTGFNWQIIKANNGVQKCAEITELMVAHNVKPNWYTCETPEDIYQLVKYCPKTAILLTGLYTIPDGVNTYLGIGRGNNRFDLSRNVHL